MSFVAAIAKVKAAVATKDLAPHLTHFLVKQGEIIATDGEIFAGAPFPDARTYLVPAKEFEKVITRLGDAAEIALEENSIVISVKRYRSRVKTLADHTQYTYLHPEGTMVKPPKGFVGILRRLRPFISDNATRRFAMAYRLRASNVTVTNNVVMARCDFAAKTKFNHLVPVWAIDNVLSRKEVELTSLQYTDKSFSFIFDDDSWLRTPLIDDAFPDDALDGVMKTAGTAKWEVTKDWREVYATVSDLSEETIRLLPDKITGGMGHQDTQGDVKTPVKDQTAWAPKFLTPVINLATHFDPALYPKPCPWHGREIKGVVMGKTT